MLGGSEQDNLFNHPVYRGEKLSKQLDRLTAAGGNYVRNTMSDRDEGNVFPFKKAGDKFDLTQWNEEYWQRFKHFLNLTEDREIIVQIELWDMWDLVQEGWEDHPWNPRNNINYTTQKSNLLTSVPFVPDEEPTAHNFFHTVPELEDNQVVLTYQERFIDHILELSLPRPHVLYCINNESGEPAEWSRYWAKIIHKQAGKRNLSAQVTDMRRKEDITDRTHRVVFDDEEVYTFADVSQNTGGLITDRNLQYERLLEVREYLQKKPRPINTVKIYNDNFGGESKFLRNIFVGLASSRFHRPVDHEDPRGLGLSQQAVEVISSLRKFTERADWFKCEPRPDLLSHTSGVYLMAEAGHQYALGFDGPGSVKLDTSDLEARADLNWMNIYTGEWILKQKVDSGDIELQTPQEEGIWLALIQY